MARTIIEQHDGDTIALVIGRKSRIIMADGKKILEKLRKIKPAQSHISLVLKTTAPIGSKTKDCLGIEGPGNSAVKIVSWTLYNILKINWSF